MDCLSSFPEPLWFRRRPEFFYLRRLNGPALPLPVQHP